MKKNLKNLHKKKMKNLLKNEVENGFFMHKFYFFSLLIIYITNQVPLNIQREN